MNTTLAAVLAFLLGALLTGAGAWWWARQRARHEAQLRAVLPDILEARHAADLAAVRASEAEVQSLQRAELAALEATVGELRDQVGEARERYAGLEQSQRIERADAQRREQEDGRILAALAPVRSGLDEMREKVGALEGQRAHQHGELSAQLRSAAEAEERLRATAENLAGALRQNNVRGVWGETQLRNVVQSAGLLERVDFDVQTQTTSDAGRGRPDMVVHLPGGKNIAVDAKVPFTAYLEASAIPADATGAEAARRSRLLAQHVRAVRDHVSTLGSRAYWEGLPGSPEIVIAFIPSESLVSSALEADPSLLEFAFGQKVALASPVTLWSVLKTVAFSWQQDVLTSEAQELFALSRELHSRLAGTAAHIEKLGRSLDRGVRDYNQFVGSLERQVFPSARKLGRLDESKLIAPLPVLEENTRPLTAVELVEALAGSELAGSELAEPDLAESAIDATHETSETTVTTVTTETSGIPELTNAPDLTDTRLTGTD